MGAKEKEKRNLRFEENERDLEIRLEIITKKDGDGDFGGSIFSNGA